MRTGDVGRPSGKRMQRQAFSLHISGSGLSVRIGSLATGGRFFTIPSIKIFTSVHTFYSR